MTLQPYGSDRATNLWLDESDGRWYPPEAHPHYHPPEPWIGITPRQTWPSPAGQRLERWLRPWRHRSALASSPDSGTTTVADVERESMTVKPPDLRLRLPAKVVWRAVGPWDDDTQPPPKSLTLDETQRSGGRS